MNKRCIVILILFFLPGSPFVHAEDSGGPYVTRKEYEELKAELLAMKKQLAAVQKERAPAPASEGAQAQASEEPAKDTSTPPPVEEYKTPVIGTSNFHIAGFGVGTFEAQNGAASNFNATFNPIFLWELNPRLLFEGRLELELSGSGTNLELEYAQLTYLLNDYITLGAGEFLTPSNVFVERFEALWIDKLPDRPLAVYDGILPERSIGVEIRGGVPVGSTRANYAFYASNGPTLNAFDAARAGTLEFNNFTDNNDNKAVGGRLGFLPVAGVEVGYGFEASEPGSQGSPLADVDAFLQSVDLNVTRNSDFLRGRLDFHAQYAFSDVDEATYDPTGAIGFGPLKVTGKRDGGYAQVAYRPTHASVDFVRDTELVFRWDHLSRDPSGFGVPEEQRWTIGLDYWLNPAVALKAAYEWDQPHGERNTNALLLQVATGF